MVIKREAHIPIHHVHAISESEASFQYLPQRTRTVSEDWHGMATYIFSPHLECPTGRNQLRLNLLKVWHLLEQIIGAIVFRHLQLSPNVVRKSGQSGH
jgi:hypothetical protein